MNSITTHRSMRPSVLHLQPGSSAARPGATFRPVTDRHRLCRSRWTRHGLDTQGATNLRQEVLNLEVLVSTRMSCWTSAWRFSAAGELLGTIAGGVIRTDGATQWATERLVAPIQTRGHSHQGTAARASADGWLTSTSVITEPNAASGIFTRTCSAARQESRALQSSRNTPRMLSEPRIAGGGSRLAELRTDRCIRCSSCREVFASCLQPARVLA